jgi:hypothetical protein
MLFKIYSILFEGVYFRVYDLLGPEYPALLLSLSIIVLKPAGAGLIKSPVILGIGLKLVSKSSSVSCLISAVYSFN